MRTTRGPGSVGRQRHRHPVSVAAGDRTRRLPGDRKALDACMDGRCVARGAHCPAGGPGAGAWLGWERIRWHGRSTPAAVVACDTDGGRLMPALRHRSSWARLAGRDSLLTIVAGPDSRSARSDLRDTEPRHMAGGYDGLDDADLRLEILYDAPHRMSALAVRGPAGAGQDWPELADVIAVAAPPRVVGLLRRRHRVAARVGSVARRALTTYQSAPRGRSRRWGRPSTIDARIASAEVASHASATTVARRSGCRGSMICPAR